MHKVFTKHFLTSAVFERSTKVLGWHKGTAIFRDHDPPPRKKTSWLFGIPRTTGSHIVLSLPETMHMVFTERTLARSVFARSIKELGRQLGAEKPQEQVSPKKSTRFFEVP